MSKSNAADYCEFNNTNPTVFDSICPRNLKCSRADDVAFLKGLYNLFCAVVGIRVGPTSTFNTTLKTVVNSVPLEEYMIA